jgi:hypothetical protein
MLSILIHTPTLFVSNVENVHLQVPNMLDDDISQLVIVETQVVAWKPHSNLLICWGYFVIDDGLHVDLVKLQMLWCIIYRFE